MMVLSGDIAVIVLDIDAVDDFVRIDAGL